MKLFTDIEDSFQVEMVMGAVRGVRQGMFGMQPLLLSKKCFEMLCGMSIARGLFVTIWSDLKWGLYVYYVTL